MLQTPSTIVHTRRICMADVPLVNVMSLMVELNGAVVSALVDTGAQCSLMHELVAQKLGLMASIDKSKLHMLTGIGDPSGVRTVGEVSVDTVVYGVQLLPSKFVIVPKCMKMNSEIILGMDFLARNGLVLHVKDATINKEFSDGSYCKWHLAKHAAGRVTFHNVKCVAANELVIPPNEERLVPIKCRSEEMNCMLKKLPSTFFCEENNKHRRPVEVTPGIIDNDHMCVLIASRNGHEQRIQKGEMLSIASTIQVVDPEDEVQNKITFQEIQEEIPLDHSNESQRMQVWKVV